MFSFCLGVAEFPEAAWAVGGTDGIRGLADSFIPSPAEEPALLAKTEETRFSFLRTISRRILIPSGTRGLAFFCLSSARTGLQISNTIDVKNTILLKIRI
jgi:hypothetical protein